MTQPVRLALPWALLGPLAAWLVVPLSFPLSAQPSAPLTDDVQVNTYTPNLQSLPAVAATESGDFVVVWQSLGSAGDDTHQYSVQARAFDAAGQALSDDVQVNAYTTGQQQWPAVAKSADGSFVVVWASRGSAGGDGSAESVQGRQFDSLGQPLATDFQVNLSTAGAQNYPDVAAASDGRFVVVWQSEASGGDDHQGYSIQGQLFAADGSLSGGEFQVNDHTPLDQARPKAAMSVDGSFMVVWESASSAQDDLSLSSIQGRRFDASGNPLGAQFQVNVVTTGGQSQPRIAMAADGQAAVVWRSQDASVDEAGGIAARRYGASGAPRGGEFRVNHFTLGEQVVPDVARDADGDMTFVWESIEGDNGDTFRSIQGRRFSSTGEALGDQMLINSLTSDAQFLPAVAGRGDGRFVGVWNSLQSPGDDGSLTSVLARPFGPDVDDDGIPDDSDLCLGSNGSGDVDGDGICADLDCDDTDELLGLPDLCGVCGGDGACFIWRDGFEKGDTSAWSSTEMGS